MHQSAYKRGVGAELHIAEMADFATEAASAGKFVSVTSLDIDGAFETASHRLLVETLVERRVDRGIIRSIANWLQQREFCIKQKSRGGTFLSGKCKVTRGVPRGGVSSLVLWVIFFRRAQDALVEQWRANKDLFEHCVSLDLVYAGDATGLLASVTPRCY